MAAPGRLAVPASPARCVSILVVVFSQAELTAGCLTALATHAGDDHEVIILDNGSTDPTAALIDRLDGARVVRASENLHFLRGVNRAALEAAGRHLLLFNNNARVAPGAIAAVAGRLDAEADLGAVGAPIVMPDGTTQEAGSII